MKSSDMTSCAIWDKIGDIPKKNCGSQIVLHRLHSITVASYTNINANLQEDLFSMFAGAYRLSTINNVPLCTSQIEASTSPPGHTPGIWLCIMPGEGGIWTLPWKGGGGEFEQIYLLF